MAHQAYELLVDVWMIPVERVASLHDSGEMEIIIERVRRAVNMKQLHRPLYIYAEGLGKAWGPGVSGFTLVTDSNLGLHTIPDDRALHFNLFSCAPFDDALVVNLLTQTFGGEIRSQLINRSVP